MTTKVYGSSDDLIEFDGDIQGEVGKYGTDDDDYGVLLICSDGTLLEIKYGKAHLGIWGITIINKGTLFDRIDPCTDEDAEPHSDVALFKDGMKWALAATEWQKVR